MSLRRLLAAVGLVAALASPAGAQDARTEQARQHFDVAQTLYAKGDFAKAAEEFMAAYKVKPFGAFVFNAAVCAEKAKDLPKAVELFRLYLSNEPTAADKVDVDRRIQALQAEIDRQSSKNVAGPAVAALPEAKTKGLVIIDSKPLGAAIYIDSKQQKPIGVTPWNGELEGQHSIILEAKGFKSSKKDISPSPDKGWYYYFELSEEHFLGWLEVRSNVDGAFVYLDRKQGGAIGRTTWLGNVQPGKHRLIVAREGYQDFVKDLEIERGKPHQVDAALAPSPTGFVRIAPGESSEGATVKLDGAAAPGCPKAPCRFEAPEGPHKLVLSKEGKKSFERELTLDRQTESVVAVRLIDTPSRTDAIWQFVYTAVFVTGGILAYNAGKDEDCLGLDPEDSKFCTYASYGLFALGGLTFATGIWYLFRDKGPPSSGTVESKNLSLGPLFGPHRAGLGTALRF